MSRMQEKCERIFQILRYQHKNFGANIKFEILNNKLHSFYHLFLIRMVKSEKWLYNLSVSFKIIFRRILEVLCKILISLVFITE